MDAWWTMGGRWVDGRVDGWWTMGGRWVDGWWTAGWTAGERWVDGRVDSGMDDGVDGEQDSSWTATSTSNPAQIWSLVLLNSQTLVRLIGV